MKEDLSKNLDKACHRPFRAGLRGWSIFGTPLACVIFMHVSWPVYTFLFPYIQFRKSSYLAYVNVLHDFMCYYYCYVHAITIQPKLNQIRDKWQKKMTYKTLCWQLRTKAQRMMMMILLHYPFHTEYNLVFPFDQIQLT